MIDAIKEVQEEAKKKVETLEWPRQKDEEWRRSDPGQIPFDVLEAVLEDAQTTADGSSTSPEAGGSAAPPVDSGAREETKDFVANIEAAVQALDGVNFYRWDNERASRAKDVLIRELERSLDKVDVWRLATFTEGGVIHIAANNQQASQKTSQQASQKTSQQDSQKDEQEPSVDVISSTLEGKSEDGVYNPCIVILVEEGATFFLDIRFLGDGFFSSGIYVDVARHARCHVNQLQDTSLDSFVINSTFANCAEEAEFANTSGQLGSMMAVDRVYAAAMGTLAHLTLHGYYLAREDQLLDSRTYQNHIAEDTNSRSLYHGLALDESHSVYRGLIQVGEAAKETDAYLTNKNLLLSEEARMDSIPCLNIATNDVRCSHGSTTGALDDKHIFYLMSRGLSEVEAKELLVEGFFRATFDAHFEDANNAANQRIRSFILGNI